MPESAVPTEVKPKEIPAEHTATTFTTPRQLHAERGYEAYSFKHVVKREKKKKHTNELPARHREEQKQVEALKEKLSQETTNKTEPFQAQEPLYKSIEDTKHIQERQGLLYTVGNGAKEMFESVKWAIGRISRGDIVKRLQRMHQNPAAYQDELQAELQRSFRDIATSEDPSLIGRHKRDAVEGVITLSTAVPFWIPVGGFLPVPFYTVGSLEVTGVNIFNTVTAFREKRFRKAAAYSAMTAIGVLTGWIPGAHNLTNTWYSELLQKSFDHSESEGMLTIASSLLNEPTNSDKHQLGKHIVQQAMTDSHATGMTLEKVSQLQELSQQKKAELLQEYEQIMKERQELPTFLSLLKDPKTLFQKTFRYGQLAYRSINVNQELVDVEHRIRSARQLHAILTQMQPLQAESIGE